MPYKNVLRQTAKDVPLDRLRSFRDRLELQQDKAHQLRTLRPTLLAHQDAFAEFFYDYFLHIDKTAAILQHETRPHKLRQNWRTWYASLFAGEVDDAFLAAVWKSGVAHVRVNIDQRYINLGYGLARTFCTDIINNEVETEQQLPALAALDALLDCCILVATDAFVEATTKCDREVVDGIAHHIRNPVTVIGGNAHLLKRINGSSAPMSQSLEAILYEAKRLEQLAGNISLYMDIFQREPQLRPVPVQELLAKALAPFAKQLSGVEVEMDIQPPDAELMADAGEVAIAMTRLLQEALNTIMESDEKWLRIGCQPAEEAAGHVEIIIDRSGPVPPEEIIQELFTPFVSLFPEGSGFDLPIARLVATKNLGSLSLLPQASQGLRMILTLPRPVRMGASLP